MQPDQFEKVLVDLLKPKPKTTAYGFALTLVFLSTLLLSFITAFVFVAKVLYWVLVW